MNRSGPDLPGVYSGPTGRRFGGAKKIAVLHQLDGKNRREGVPAADRVDRLDRVGCDGMERFTLDPALLLSPGKVGDRSVFIMNLFHQSSHLRFQMWVHLPFPNRTVEKCLNEFAHVGFDDVRSVDQRISEVIPFEVQKDEESFLLRFFDECGVEIVGIAAGPGAGDDHAVHRFEGLGEQLSDRSLGSASNRLRFLNQLGGLPVAENGDAGADLALRVGPQHGNPVFFGHPDEFVLSFSSEVGQEESVMTQLGKDSGGVHPFAGAVEVVFLGSVHLPEKKGGEHHRDLEGGVQTNGQQSHERSMCNEVWAAFSWR